MKVKDLQKILKKHKNWLRKNGNQFYGSRDAISPPPFFSRMIDKFIRKDGDPEKADLRGAALNHIDLSFSDLRMANLEGADLRGADLSSADLRDTNLKGAKLTNAKMDEVNLKNANLSRADLGGAYLFGANLSNANLRDACLCYTDLSYADLGYTDLNEAFLCEVNMRCADLRGVKGYLSPIEYIENNFKKTSEGILCYKTFEQKDLYLQYKEGTVLFEVVNPDRSTNRVSLEKRTAGIPVATLEWIRKNTKILLFWECLIKWEWMAGIIVPYNTEGDIRAEKVQLLKSLKKEYSWIPKDKGTINPKELGEKLFLFIQTTALNFLKDDIVLECLEAKREDKHNMSRLVKETIIALLFSVTLAFERTEILQDSVLEKDILDNIHQAFYLSYKEQDPNVNFLLKKRFLEYQSALKEKRGPNWLWSLTSHFLANLKQKKTQDYRPIIMLTSLLDSVIKETPVQIKKYKSTKENK